MEVVLLLVAIVGIALLVVPRLQRRSGATPRPKRATPRRTSARRRSRTAPAVAAPAVATWTPSEPAQAPQSTEDWDDDLGWEGVESSAPDAREAWQEWRATKSPLAPQAEPEPEPELPSVERWRQRASEETDWEEDDDGLGWEGESSTAPVLWKHGPEPAPEPSTNEWDSGRDWSRDEEPPARVEQPEAPAFASASAAQAAATDVAEPEVGRAVSLSEDDEWAPPVGRSWGAPEETKAAPVPAPERATRRTRKLHPVVVLAVYAAVGIGLVVLASTLLLGGSSDPEPVRNPAPTPEQTPAPAAPAATPAVGSAADDAATAEAAAKAEAAARKAKRQFERTRDRAVRTRGNAVDDARADARREARAKARRKRERERAASAPSPRRSNPAPPASPTATPPPTYNPQPRSNPAPAPKRQTCEFCIG